MMILLCDDSGLKFRTWRKPNSYLGWAKPEPCKPVNFAVMAVVVFFSSLPPFYTHLSLYFKSGSRSRSSFDGNPVHFSSKRLRQFEKIANFFGVVDLLSAALWLDGLCHR